MTNKSTSIKLTLKITSFIMRMLLNIMFYIVVIMLVINVSKMAFDFTYQLYGSGTMDPVGSGKEIIFQINKGESTMDVASKLEVTHVIKDKYSFYLKVKLGEYVIMPGTYEISSDMNYDEILSVITDYSASIIKDNETEGSTGDGAKTDAEAGSKTDTN